MFNYLIIMLTGYVDLAHIRPKYEGEEIGDGKTSILNAMKRKQSQFLNRFVV